MKIIAGKIRRRLSDSYRKFAAKHLWRGKQKRLKQEVCRVIAGKKMNQKESWIHNFTLLFDGAKEWQIYFHEQAWRGFAYDTVEEITRDQNHHISHEEV